MITGKVFDNFQKVWTSLKQFFNVFEFLKNFLWSPLCTLWSPLCIWPKFFKSCFYRSKVIVLITGKVFDNFQKVWTSLKQFFNVFEFLKNFLWSPLCTLWSPLCIWPKFFKSCFYRSKVIVLITGKVFDNFQKVWTSLKQFFNVFEFLKNFLWSPLCTLWSPLCIWPKFFKSCFYRSKVIVLITGKVFDNFQKVWTSLKQFFNVFEFLKNFLWSPLCTLWSPLCIWPKFFKSCFYRSEVIVLITGKVFDNFQKVWTSLKQFFNVFEFLKNFLWSPLCTLWSPLCIWPKFFKSCFYRSKVIVLITGKVFDNFQKVWTSLKQFFNVFEFLKNFLWSPLCTLWSPLCIWPKFFKSCFYRSKVIVLITGKVFDNFQKVWTSLKQFFNVFEFLKNFLWSPLCTLWSPLCIWPKFFKSCFYRSKVIVLITGKVFDNFQKVWTSLKQFFNVFEFLKNFLWSPLCTLWSPLCIWPKFFKSCFYRSKVIVLITGKVFDNFQKVWTSLKQFFNVFEFLKNFLWSPLCTLWSPLCIWPKFFKSCFYRSKVIVLITGKVFDNFQKVWTSLKQFFNVFEFLKNFLWSPLCTLWSPLCIWPKFFKSCFYRSKVIVLITGKVFDNFQKVWTSLKQFFNVFEFLKNFLWSPLCTLWSPLCIWPKFFKSCFYRSKVIVLITGKVFDNFQKVWTSLKQFFNVFEFLKNFLWSPLCTLWSPLCIWPKFFKSCFYRSKVIVLITGKVFDNFQKVWTSLKQFFNVFEFLKNFLWSPLCTLWSPLCIWPKFFKSCFYRSKVIVLITGKVFDNFQKVWTSLKQFFNVFEFLKNFLWCPLCTLWCPLCIWPKFFKSCFYRSKVIVLITGKVFNNFQKVWTSLKQFFNVFEFLKNFLWSPLCTLWSPLCIWPKFFKSCFYRSKVIVLITGKVFDNFQKVWTSLKQFFNVFEFLKNFLWSPLCTLWSPYASDRNFLNHVFIDPK